MEHLLLWPTVPRARGDDTVGHKMACIGGAIGASWTEKRCLLDVPRAHFLYRLLIDAGNRSHVVS